MTRWSDFFLGATVGIIGCVAILLTTRQACADDLKVSNAKVRPVVLSVIAALSDKKKGDGLLVDPLPAVFVTKLHGNAVATTVGGKIYLSDERDQCFVADLAHEAVHWLLGKYQGQQPSQSEEMARKIEPIVSPDTPNCWSTQP